MVRVADYPVRSAVARRRHPVYKADGDTEDPAKNKNGRPPRTTHSVPPRTDRVNTPDPANENKNRVRVDGEIEGEGCRSSRVVSVR